MIVSFVLFLCILQNANSEYFDSYRKVILTKKQVDLYQRQGKLEQCANKVELPCDPHAWRRIDDSCNNLGNPSYGTVNTPFLRLLEPVFGKDLRDRESESVGKLPPVRLLRTKILDEGSRPHPLFTQLVPFFLLFSFTDNGSIQDTLNYAIRTTYCCEPRGRGDYQCTPHEIPEDDPVHRFTGVRCMNQTRPITYQSYGCLQNGTTIPARINDQTPLFDLSSVYYYQGKTNERTYKSGELVLDKINGKLWPKNNNTKDDICVENKLPQEGLCFKGASNGVIGGKYIAVLLFRLHNYIAKILAALNPCWDDERLFYAARLINVAIEQQIFMYELMPELMGEQNLINEGIISECQGYRDIYDENILPQITEEYVYVLRYFHTVQDAKVKRYNRKGEYLNSYFPITNFTLRTGYLLPGNNFEEITQSSFRQACAGFDQTVDPAISELGLGGLQYSLDITMNDLAKARTIGFQGYLKYREYCSNKTYKDFEDLYDVMTPERIDILRDAYSTAGDIDLLAGIWSEGKVHGGRVPHTVYCLMVEQLKRFIKADRFWFERKNKPHALSVEQLCEIRKASIAWIICAVGDGVTEIQRRAFLRITPKNPLVKCSEIPFIDFSKWKDDECKS